MSEREIRILFAEDDESFHRILRDKLSGLPVNITTATTHAEAFQLVRGGRSQLTDDDVSALMTHPPYDLVITDVHLADTRERGLFGRNDGYEIAEQSVWIGMRTIIASVTDTPSRQVKGAPMYDKIRAMEEARKIVTEILQK